MSNHPNRSTFPASGIMEAIERSRSHNEIVTVHLAPETIEEALGHLLSAYADSDGEVDYVRNGEVIEVWGWTGEQDEGEMDFRVHLARTTD